MNTVLLLMAEFESAEIPLADISERYFGVKPGEKMLRMASRQQFPVPVHRLGSQRSPWMVHVRDLADYIDRQAEQAREVHERLREAS